MPGPDAPPEEVVEALRLRALSALIYADAVAGPENPAAFEAREAACRLRCQAAVIEAMAVLYEELGLTSLKWGEFAAAMSKVAYPR